MLGSDRRDVSTNPGPMESSSCILIRLQFPHVQNKDKKSAEQNSEV